MMRHDTGDLVAYVVHGCWDGAALTRTVRVRSSTAHHARRSHTTTTVHAHAKSLEKDSCAIQSRGKESPVNTCHNITPLASGIRFRKGGGGGTRGSGAIQVPAPCGAPRKTSYTHKPLAQFRKKQNAQTTKRKPHAYMPGSNFWNALLQQIKVFMPNDMFGFGLDKRNRTSTCVRVIGMERGGAQRGKWTLEAC